MKPSISIDVALLISLITAFFYGCGQSYLAAYMAVFFIDPVVLNFPTPEKINWGFLNCANWLTIILLAILILSFIVYILAILKISYPFQLFTRFKSKKKPITQIHNQSLIEEQQINRIRLFFWPFFICLLSLSSFITFALIDIKTTKSANRVLNHPYQLPKIKVVNVSERLFLIKCGASLCAVIDENKNVSLVEPKNITLYGSNFTK